MKELPKKLFGHKILSYLGEGAASHLYVAADPETGKKVALKHVIRETEKHDRYVDQLTTEYEVGKRVRHPVLRKSLDLQTHRSLLLRHVTEAALILELVDGTPIDKGVTAPLRQTLERFLEVARGVESMHEIGYVHCDLKPENILLTPDGHLRLIDFGQACLPGTVKRRIQGSADYMAPEQYRLEALSFKTDVYNFGATLYRMVTGRAMPTLFTAPRGESRKTLEKRIPTPVSINPKLPHALSEMIMRCVRSDPTKRPEMREIVAHLAAMLQGGNAKAAQDESGLVKRMSSRQRIEDASAPEVPAPITGRSGNPGAYLH